MEHLRVVFIALHDARLFGNLGKCTFCTDRVSFLGYVVTPQGIEVDKAKIEAIESWPQPKTVTQVIEAGVSRSFDEMITIDLVETTLTIRLQTCNDSLP